MLSNCRERYIERVLWVFIYIAAPVIKADVTQTDGSTVQVSVTGQLILGSPAITVWGASYGSDNSSKDFSFQIGDTDGASDQAWLRHTNTIATSAFGSEAVCASASRQYTLLFPIARYQLCVDSNNSTGAFIKVLANRFIQASPGTHQVPLYAEVIANGLASSGNTSFLFSSDNTEDIANLGRSIHRYKDSRLNNDGTINHGTSMTANDWVTTGHNNSEYSTFTKGSGSYIALDHFSANDGSASSYDLDRNQTIAADPTNFKYDATTFADANACPTNSRIDVYLYVDLACLLVAPGAVYSGSVNIDLSSTNS